MNNKTTTYSRLQIALHWAVAGLIILNYFVSEGMGRAFHQHLESSDQGYNLVSSIHVYVGLAIIVLVIIRLIVRVFSKIPEPTSKHAVLDHLAKGLHHLLYLLMFLVPVLGASAWFLGIHLMGDMHEITMNIMMSLVLVHALAAIFHQWVLKDGTLLKMLGRK